MSLIFSAIQSHHLESEVLGVLTVWVRGCVSSLSGVSGSKAEDMACGIHRSAAPWSPKRRTIFTESSRR